MRLSKASYQTSESKEDTGEEVDTDKDYGKFKEDFGAGAYTDSESENSDMSEDDDEQPFESNNTDLKSFKSEPTVSVEAIKYCCCFFFLLLRGFEEIVF